MVNMRVHVGVGAAPSSRRGTTPCCSEQSDFVFLAIPSEFPLPFAFHRIINALHVDGPSFRLATVPTSVNVIRRLQPANKQLTRLDFVDANH